MRLFIVICVALASAGAGLTDSIDVSDPISVDDHGYTPTGKVETAIAGDVVGGHDMRRSVQVVHESASVAYQLKVTPGEWITLEFEEIDNRDLETRGYLVMVDGVRVALRTWETCGAGPIHYFVTFPPREKETITVKLVNQGKAPFRISRIWAFCDFAGYFDNGAMNVAYRIAPTVRLKDDFDADLAELQKLKTSLGRHPNVQPAWTASIPYAKRRESLGLDRIDHLLRLAEAAQMPVQLCFNTWWSGTPNGPDGAGGTWSDESHQQRVWNDTTKTMQLSVPNRWSNCPWLSVNDEKLNKFKVERLKKAVAHFRSRLGESGKRDLVMAINLDNEPVYWASGNAGLGMDLLQADFSDHAVFAAKRDGISLDPTDGLTFDERKWLWRNLLNYNELIGRTMVESLGRDDADHPDGPLVDNVYTQAMVANPWLQYPMLSPAYPLWESAAPSSVRCGGEWDADSVAEQQAVLRQLPLGRSAAVNSESDNDAGENRGVRVGYALGQRYFTPYNYPLDKLDVATADLHDVSQALPPMVFRPTLIEHDFSSDGWKKLVVSHEGLTVGRLGNRPAIGIYPSRNDKAGFLQYKLASPDGKPFESLQVELFGRAIDFRNPSATTEVRVFVDGTEAGGVSGEKDVNQGHAVDLSDHARGKRELDVRIELDPGKVEMTQWCSIWRIRFTIGWPTDLRDLVPQDWSLKTMRKRSLLVSWRRDAELAIARAPTAEAKAAYARGEYATAYRLSAKASR